MGRSFLTSKEWNKAKEVFPPVLWTPNGDVRFTSYFGGYHFSNWLESVLEEKLKSYPEFLQCEPVLLGSWSRGELCPLSDIDILFSGPDDKVKVLTDKLHQAGLRVRYRVPANPDDWTEGVESFDILALWKAKPLSSQAAAKLLRQQKLLWEKKNKIRANLLRDLAKEKKHRESRFNSISNYLEPNLKYGPGGLRDIEQALQVFELFSDKFINQGHALSVLNYHKAYLLTLRQKIHLMDCGEVLDSTAQFELAEFFNFKNHKDFMRDLERGLSRSHFYVNWIFSVAKSSEKKLNQSRRRSIREPKDLIAVLKDHPDSLGQQKIRENLDQILPDSVVGKSSKWFGKILDEMLDPNTSLDYTRGIFESRLIDKILPAIRHLVGYVQHDQYHRYTADIHIMQACLGLKEIFKQPGKLGPLKALHRKLDRESWRIISWACLYHDLAKGLQAEDHAKLGTEIVRRDFKKYGFTKSFTDEVAWLVNNHLELSVSAFRKNPKARKTWEDLESKGAKGERLVRLAVFTVIDIRATNPDAWSEWKGKLLKELVDVLSSESTQNYFSLKTRLKTKKNNDFESILINFDAFVLEALPAAVLAQDLRQARDSQDSLAPLVYSKGQTMWVRFHSKIDHEGLLAGYVQRLYSLGLGIRHAAIQTLPGVGVYDWFQVNTSKTSTTVKKIINTGGGIEKKEPVKVHYDRIEWVTIDNDEWILSFRGRDQNGFLSSATQALAKVGLNIRSARVHTWGRQVDDVFTLVSPGGKPELYLEKIKSQLGLSLP